MDHLEEILLTGLRRGDAAACCGAGQFVLLPQADYDASRAVCARLIRTSRRRYPHTPVHVSFFVQPLVSGPQQGGSV